MVTMERDLLMMPLPNLAPMPTPLLTPDTVTMVTMERDLLSLLMPLSLALTPMPTQQLTPGTVTTGLTVMDTGVATGPMPTGDKKWTSTTSNNIRSFPADSSLKRQFLQNNFLFTLLKNSFVLCIRVPGTVFNYLQSRNNKNLK